MIEGSIILLVGIITGRFLPGRRRTKVRATVCDGCGHHQSFHQEGGRCMKNSQFIDAACKCTTYIGPEPLPAYYAPEIR